jgi:hypothetical protein
MPNQGTAKIEYSPYGLITYYNFMLAPRFALARHMTPVCHALMDQRIRKLLITIGPGAGKSLLLSCVYASFEIGHDPEMTVLNISAGEGLVQGFQRTVGEWIEYSDKWSTIFPDVRPDKARGWSSDRGLFVTGHPHGDPDASYFACGLTSKQLTGVHGRLILGDDLHDKENSASVEACLNVRSIYMSQIIGRADPRGCRFVFSGRRWHQEDIYGFLAQTGEWVHMNLPALRENSDELFWDVTIPKDLECCFTDGSMRDLEVIRVLH